MAIAISVFTIKSYGAGNTFSIQWTGDFLGQGLRIDSGLQEKVGSSRLIVKFSKFLGTDKGLVVGGGFGSWNRSYIFNSRTNEITSSYRAGFVQSGYWWSTTSKSKVIALASGGLGKYDITQNVSGINENGTEVFVSAQARYSFVYELSSSLDVGLSIGGGASKIFLPDYNISGDKLSGKTLGENVFLLLGVDLYF